MNKSDLINAIASGAGTSKAVAAKMWESVEKFIGHTLAIGEEVSLPGFGRFGIRQLAERTIKNPRTQELMHVKASIIPIFKPGKNLKQMASGQVEEGLSAEETTEEETVA